MRDYDGLIKTGNAARLEKLIENDHKTGFDNIDIGYAIKRIKQERKELKEAYLIMRAHPTPETIRNVIREAADVGNFSDMVIYTATNQLKKD